MFGVLKLFGSIVGNVGESVIEYKENERKRKNYTNPITNTYTDYRGRTRDASSNQIRYVERQVGGGIVIKDKNFNVIRDLRQEEIDRTNAQILREGGVVTTKKIIDNGNAHRDCNGEKCIDLKTGKTYTVRYVQNINNKMNGYTYEKELRELFKFNIEFYVDAQTGEFIRPTDSEINRNIVCKRLGKTFYTNEQYDEVIRCINECQKNTPKHLIFYTGSKRHIPYKLHTLKEIEERMI